MLNRCETIGRIVGLGLDKDDGCVRITNGSAFTLMYGSEESHDQMQAFCLRMESRLREQGRSLQDLTRGEFLRLASECSQSRD